MAFRTPSEGQVLQNRKMLQAQLNEKKESLKSGVAVSAPAATQGIPAAPKANVSTLDPAHMSNQQRTALQHAHQNSVGYFVTQDSAFGNLILPVIPRFDK